MVENGTKKKTHPVHISEEAWGMLKPLAEKEGKTPSVKLSEIVLANIAKEI